MNKDKDLDARKMRRWQSVRSWCIILSAALLLAGYLADRWLLMCACVPPLAAAAGITLILRNLERKKADEPAAESSKEGDSKTDERSL